MHIGGMQHGCAVRPWVDHPRGGRRHTGANLLGAERVADVIDPDTGILVGGKDQLFADKAAGAALDGNKYDASTGVTVRETTSDAASDTR